MTDIYGKAFTSTYGATPNATWSGVILTYEPNQIAGAFQRLKANEKFRKFPPNLFEFEDLIKNLKHDSHKQVEFKQEFTEEDQKRGQAAIQKIMSELQAPKPDKELRMLKRRWSSTDWENSKGFGSYYAEAKR